VRKNLRIRAFVNCRHGHHVPCGGTVIYSTSCSLYSHSMVCDHAFPVLCALMTRKIIVLEKVRGPDRRPAVTQVIADFDEAPTTAAVHAVQLKFHRSSFLVASSRGCRAYRRGCYEETAPVEFRFIRWRRNCCWRCCWFHHVQAVIHAATEETGSDRCVHQ